MQKFEQHFSPSKDTKMIFFFLYSKCSGMAYLFLQDESCKELLLLIVHLLSEVCYHHTNPNLVDCSS